MQLTIPNSFANGTEEINTIDAPKMNANFAAVVTVLNGNVDYDNLKVDTTIVQVNKAAAITGIYTFQTNPVFNAAAIPDAALSANIMKRSVYDADLDGIVESADFATDADTVDGQHAAAFAPVAHNHDATYAPIANGVTNGNAHDHIGGDGAAIAEGALSLSDVTTGDVSLARHGFVPKAPGDTQKFLRADGSWAAPVPPGRLLSLTVQAGVIAVFGSSQTLYLGGNTRPPATGADRAKIYIPKSGTITVAYIYWYSNEGGDGAEGISVYIRKNNTTDTLVATVANTLTGKLFSNIALSIAVVQGDYIEIKVVGGAFVVEPLNVGIGGTIVIEQ